MPRYRYRALSADNAMLDGEIVAQTEREAARLLERRGLSPVDLREAGAAAPGRATGARGGARSKRLRQQDLGLAMHELSTLLNAGVGLADAVDAQARSARHPVLVHAFEGISAGLRQGLSFSQTLAASGLALPDYVTTLVRSGEQAGMLGRALRDAVTQMEYDQLVRHEIRQALTYPAVLVAAGLGAVILMFTFVVPKFSALLNRAEDLPWLASAVLTTGMLSREYWWVLVLGLGVAGVWGARAFRDPARRARGFEQLERLPVIGAWRVEAETAAWSRILATLLGNRVALLDALSLAQSGVRAPGRRARLEEASRAVRNGATLADALEEQDTLSPTGYNLVRVGERAGELPTMLQSLAKLCEDAGRARMKQFLALLEPLAIMLIGGVIGIIMIGIILAITSANDIAV